MTLKCPAEPAEAVTGFISVITDAHEVIDETVFDRLDTGVCITCIFYFFLFHVSF